MSDSDDGDNPFETLGCDEELRVDEVSLVQAELRKLMAKLDVEGDETTQVEVCQELEHLLRNRSESKTAVMVNHQVLPMLEMLDHPSASVIFSVLRLVHEVMTDRHKQSSKGKTRF